LFYFLLELVGFSVSAPALSWRGRRDPTLLEKVESMNRKAQQGIPPPESRKEWEGFGGMNRRR
jgi:hypothetical protein